MRPALAVELALVDNTALEALPRIELVHDYGGMSLVELEAAPRAAEPEGAHIHLVPGSERVSFRSWSAAAAGWVSLAENEPALVVLCLVGPLDGRWAESLRDFGLQVLGTAHPFGIVVRATAPQLERARGLRTSAGVPVLRAALALPPAARLSRELLHAAQDGKARAVRTHRLGAFKVAVSRQALTPAQLWALAARDRELWYVEPEYPIELHNNLVALPELMAVEPVRQSLGLTGEGMIVGHNDTGVDLDHPELPPEAIRATVGVMRYTDTGHGTHTAASLAGRGVTPAPRNDAGCGDQIAGAADPRGMAWGAQLVVNNIMEGGLPQVPDMMRWAVRHGATLSTNSWGHGGPQQLVNTYNEAAVEVDAAVRDADPESAGSQPLTIFFSAGNRGPNPGTVSAPSTAKNSITVGASENLRCGSYVPDEQAGPAADAVLELSGRGPSQQRVKPDLVAPGSDVLSAQSGDVEATAPWDQEWTGPELSLGTGTSMSCPLAAGAGTLFAEARWRDTGVRPSPALVKAGLINGATDLGLDRTIQGWGRLNLERSVLGPSEGQVSFFDSHELPTLVTGDVWRDTFEVFSAAAPLKLTLVWTDVPGEADSDHPLVNDLDLLLVAPDGATYRGNLFDGRWSQADPGSGGDRHNTVENIFVELPQVGQWRLEVVAVQVARNPPDLAGQDFALVYSGDAAPCASVAPAPQGVVASVVGPNQVRVSWDRVAEATAYRISRAATPGGRPYVPQATIDAAASSWLDETVEGGLDYYYVVEALVDCWSPRSGEAEVRATGACRLPPLFQGLGEVGDQRQEQCRVQLEWQPASAPCGGELAYRVYRSTSPDFSPGPSTLVADAVRGSSWQDVGLPPDLPQYYLVRAVDLDNGAADENSEIVSVAPQGPVELWFRDDGEADTVDLVEGIGSYADSGASVWTRSPDNPHAGAAAWYCPDAEQITDRALRLAEPMALPDAPALTLEFWHRHDLQPLWDGARLEYSVDNGRSWQDILAGDGFAVPDNHTRLRDGAYEHTIASGGSGNPLAGAAGWTGRSKGWERVLVDLGDFAGWQLLLRWRLGLDDGTAVGGGWWVDDIRIFRETSCQSCAPPLPPAQVVATPAEQGIDLSWQAVPGAVGYEVARSEQIGGPWVRLAEVAAPSTHYLDATASGGSTYSYVVRSRAPCRSAPSTEAVAVAGGRCHLAPVFWGLDRVASKQTRTCALELSWQNATSRCPGAEVAYHVYRGTRASAMPGATSFLATVRGASSYTDYELCDDARFLYLVRAFDCGVGVEDRNRRTLMSSASGPSEVLFEDDMEGSEEAWVTKRGSSADELTERWKRVYDEYHSFVFSWFVKNEKRTKDQTLQLVDSIAIPNTPEPRLRFWQYYDMEFFWDGGRLEYSLDLEHWFDILEGDGEHIPANPGRFLAGGYSGTLQVGGSSNPLAGQPVWTGAAEDWYEVVVDLADFAGRSIWLRWRHGSDDSHAGEGWWIDDVHIDHVIPCGARVEQPPRRGRGTIP